MDYFERLQELLKIERQEDRQSYQQLLEKSTVVQRRSNGLAWYPVAIRGSEISRGDYLTVEIERTTHHEISHQLRFGMPAVLFSNHDAKNNRAEGLISHQFGNTLKITLQTDELPEWAGDGKLGIDLLFDDTSYDEMQNALKSAALNRQNDKDSRLINVLIGDLSPCFVPSINQFANKRLNPSQHAAVEKILSAEDLAIVHGPPGTGKTTTLVQAIKALAEQDKKQLLVVAPSNTAVDLLSEKLSEEGLNVLRVGNPVRVSERLLSLTLDSKVAAHPRMKEIKNLKKQANEFRNMAHKYKRNFGRAEREQRKALFDEAHKIMKDVYNTEQYVIDDVLAKSQVIAATLVGANHYTVKKLKYHTVVIDEAGQSLEPAAWIPILKARKLIMAGDHLQLPPTVKSNEAMKKGLGVSLLEKAVALHPDAVVLLDEQYRMNETIMGFSSMEFYDNRVKAHPSVANHLLFDGDQPLEFIDTAGCGFEEKTAETSITNPEEAAFMVKHLSELVRKLKERDKKFSPSIGVISPYKQQILLLQELVQHSPELKALGRQIAVNTIDSFQGQERDIIYIGMTRSNSNSEIGFLADIRRMNVAMTRARKKLVVIGDSATLSVLPFYHDFISYAEKHNAYKSAWEFMND
ncbi:MAG: AAA family ATPase [Gemmatimonadaceae bacterium]|nr:AAA family ATPase [Chitinophagaceae bacterium]